MSLSSFFKQNALPMPTIEKPISKRFVGEDGKPILWKVKGVDETKNAEIKTNCTKMVTEKGGKQRMHFDANLYNALLAAEAVIYPDLRNTELQQSYEVYGADNLLRAMLSAGEFARLTEAVQEVCDFDLEDAIKDAKNSLPGETESPGTATS